MTPRRVKTAKSTFILKLLCLFLCKYFSSSLLCPKAASSLRGGYTSRTSPLMVVDDGICGPECCCEDDGIMSDEGPGGRIQLLLQNEQSRRDFMLRSMASAGVLSSLFYDSTSSALAVTDIVSTTSTSTNLLAAEGGEAASLLVPYSSVRKYKSITLANGMQVLLVSDRRKKESQAALTIGGAGQFSNPENLDGLAHCMEHMILSATNRWSGRIGQKKSKDFEEWISDYDGSSNGFTAYEKVCFHFNCRTEAFSEALERFASLFLEEAVKQTCRDEQTLKREIRRIDSEIDSGNDFTRELYLTKSLINQDHPYAKLSAGNLETLETFPSKLGIDVGESLIEFFKQYYQPTKAILVVVSPSDIPSLEYSVAPFSSTMSKERLVSTNNNNKRNFPEFFPKRNRLSTICLFRRKTSSNNPQVDDIEKLTFQWALNLDYYGDDVKLGTESKELVTATQIGFIIAQIISRRGPGSLYALLKRRNWIPDGMQGIPRISFPVDVSGFQILKLQLSLTLQGFSSRSSVIAAVYDSINSIQNSLLSSGSFLLRRELIAEYATVAKLYGYELSPRPPDAIELAFDGQVYGISGTRGVANPEWRLFPDPQDKGGISAIQKALQDVFLKISDPGNALITTTASKKAILFAESNLLESSLPPLSPASWNISPVTGARYYFDNMIRLSGRANEWLVARLMEDELSPPVLNPLIPSILRPPRLLDKIGPSSIGNDPLVLVDDDAINDPKQEQPLPSLRENSNNKMKNEDITKPSIFRDYWAVLSIMGHDSVSYGLSAPRIPPEPSCRSMFVLQLISSRPARADAKKAAHAELWKRSLEYAVSDLVRCNLVAVQSATIGPESLTSSLSFSAG